MRIFRTRASWTSRFGIPDTKQWSHSCRDLLLHTLNYTEFRVGTDRKLVLINTTHDLPENMLQEICIPARLQYTMTAQPDAFAVTKYEYELSGNDDTILMAYYWLVLGERLLKYYSGDFGGMIEGSKYQAWDYKSDQEESLPIWRAYQAGQIIPTNDLFRTMNNPINYYRNQGAH